MSSSSNYSNELKQKLTEIHAMILENITTAQSKQKQKYGGCHRPDQIRTLNAGDCLAAQYSHTKRRQQKIRKVLIWTGPFIVQNLKRGINHVVWPQSGKGTIARVYCNEIKLIPNHDRKSDRSIRTHPTRRKYHELTERNNVKRNFRWTSTKWDE